eukprot:m.131197 g.131197  ORF g.131197 m.131197 type:complete len:77 (-) comp15903_c0_seq2:89-319(-)
MQLPKVKTGRARMLVQAGYRTLVALASAAAEDVAAKVAHLGYDQACDLIAAARTKLLEESADLRDQAAELANLQSQ